MASKTSKICITVLINLALFQFFAQKTYACWFGEESEVVRIAMFRAEMADMAAFRPFYYSAKYLNSYIPDYSADRMQNILMWQKELGAELKISDIEAILYLASATDFISSFEKKTLNKQYVDNSLIKKLLLPANKAYLDYFVHQLVSFGINQIIKICFICRK